MQIVFDEEVARRANLTDVQLRAESIGATEHVTLPLKCYRARLLLYSGGACGKTRIINCVLAKVFRRFSGNKGLVLKAFSNKAARLIQSKNLAYTHHDPKWSISHYASIACEGRQRKTSTGSCVGASGSISEGRIHHAAWSIGTCNRSARYVWREQYHDLKCAKYARPETNYASLPYVITAGDPLQFPPVPATSSLLAGPDGQTKEHRVAQAMFEDQDYVCELKATMRFQGDRPHDKLA